MVTKGAVVLLTVFIASKITYCQTCCTGSAPTIGSMRVSSVDAKKWNINILFEHNNISDIIIKKNKINDNSINRATNTILLQTTFGITQRISAIVILPYVYKTEQTTSSTNSFENSSSGLGDISTIIQYSVFTNDQFYSIIGGGLKWATGATQKVDKVSQLLQQPSLQPGTGSYDYLFLSLFNWSLPFRKSLSAQQVFSYQLTGISKRFASHESYKFGNELQSFTAVSDQFPLYSKVIVPSIMVRISYREKNRINDFEDINSGGIWVYVSPGFIVKFNDSLNVFTQGDFPIYQNVNGHQLTTSYLLRVGFFVTL